MSEFYVSSNAFKRWETPRVTIRGGEVNIFFNLYISLSLKQAQELVDAFAEAGIKADPMNQEEASEYAKEVKV